MTGRRKAFAKPVSPDWRPKIGEQVYLPPWRKQLGRVTSSGEVTAVFDDIIRICAIYLGNVVIREYLYSDLRPIPKKRTRKVPQ